MPINAHVAEMVCRALGAESVPAGFEDFYAKARLYLDRLGGGEMNPLFVLNLVLLWESTASSPSRVVVAPEAMSVEPRPVKRKVGGWPKGKPRKPRAENGGIHALDTT